MGRTHARAPTHRRRLWVVLLITGSILVAQLIGALLANSVALLADAGHVLADVAGIGLALAAIRLASRPGGHERTYGLYRVEILAAAANAVLLLGVSAFVLYEAWRRLFDPQDVAGGVMLGFALAGLVGNGLSLWLLRDVQRGNLNARGAYLEVLGDLLGSAAVIAAAIAITATGYTRADPMATAVIGLMILPRTWKLLRDAVDVLLEATPKDVDMNEVRRHILETAGVEEVHDLHAWTITSGMNVLSAHVVLDGTVDPPVVLDALCDCLSGDFDIEHSTFQLESTDRRRIEQSAHP